MARRRRTVLVLVVVLSGCEQDCLSHWGGKLGCLGILGEGSNERPRGNAPDLALDGTDCSDGLLRCIGGRVEASRAAHLPYPCAPERAAERQSTCVCPWDVIGDCPSGCASDGLEVIVAATDAGGAQLCRPDAPVARLVLPGDPISTEICAQEGVVCVDGIVRVCDVSGQPSRALATCLNGCQSDVAIDDMEPGATKDPDGLVSILCRRGHAERQ